MRSSLCPVDMEVWMSCRYTEESCQCGMELMGNSFEITTWNQLGIHPKPIVLVNINGYYDGIIAWQKRAIEDGFVKTNMESIFVVVDSVEAIPQAIEDYKPATGRFNLDWNSE
jgi:predicted Rossmann-fold nucleotide-binding protein